LPRSPVGDRAPESKPRLRPTPETAVREEFSAFYKDYIAKLVAYIMYLGASREEAAEAAQETMIKALRNWRDIEHSRAWCRTTASREYLRRRFGSEEPYDEVPANGEPLVPPSDDFEEFERRHDILRLVRQLPPKQRLVMAMTLDGATPAEIARDLGHTPEQVRSNLRLARKQLARLLDEASSGEEKR
jgi:RNA polymerase sigma-70 factor (ECF subfamily)